MSIRLQRLVWVATLLFAFSMSSESVAAPHARDDFYVQLTTGFGLPHFAITADDAPDHYASSESGVSACGSLLLGVPLRPGVVLGVGGLLALSFTSSPKITRNGQPWALVDVQEQSSLFTSIVGPFVDIYPSSTLGWHMQALAGYANVTYAQITQHPFFDGSPSGIGLMAGVGHDWWINAHWSIGLLARVSYASMQLAPTANSDRIGSISEHNTLVSPSLEASFTAH
ncbi:MAG TPA: hypothetical protein VNW92_11030 [Polyangiaceae bacterium]|jgi:hypothetical protein|nr:hypothetical protein [Polyangiaceae bacterium]